MTSPTRRIELPLKAYEAFLDLQGRILRMEVDFETARYETIEIIAPYCDGLPEPWEASEVVLKKTPMSILHLPVGGLD